MKKAKAESAELLSDGVSEGVPEMAETADGQYALLKVLPDIPPFIKKAYGPTYDVLLRQELDGQTQVIEIDDTNNSSVLNEPLPIQTRIMLSYQGPDLEISGRVKLTAFDREVLDAVASLSLLNTAITDSMIFQVLMGKQGYQQVTAKQRERVAISIRKCAYSSIKIDLKDTKEKDSPIAKELRKKGVKLTFEGYLLPIQLLSAEQYGKRGHLYHILCEPAIIQYAASIGKIDQFPIALLDTNVSKTERTIILQSFLLRCIASMYRGETGNHILMTDVYRAIEASDDTDQHKLRYRKTAEKILGDWINKNFIVGYEVRRVGTRIKGFNITLMPESPIIGWTEQFATTTPKPALPPETKNNQPASSKPKVHSPKQTSGSAKSG